MIAMLITITTIVIFIHFFSFHHLRKLSTSYAHPTQSHIKIYFTANKPVTSEVLTHIDNFKWIYGNFYSCGKLCIRYLASERFYRSIFHLPPSLMPFKTEILRSVYL